MTTIQIIAIIVIFIVGGGGALLPLVMQTRVSPRAMSRGNAFAGGVLLAAGLIHLLPDANDGFNSAYPDLDYPAAFAVATLAFILVLGLERVVPRAMAFGQEEGDLESAALVGAGNIGRALLSYDHFTMGDFHIAAVFDSNDRAIGREYGGREIQPMDRMGELVQHHEIMLGIIAVPAPAAQVVADHMIEAGITGILNFAPRRLEVGDDVSITSVDFTLALEQLAFQVSLGLSGSLDDDPS